MQPIILNNYTVKLSKNNIKLTVETITAPDKCTAIDSALLIIKTENDLANMHGWNGKAIKI